MKTEIIKQEILLVIAAFSQQQLCEKNAPESLNLLSPAEELEAACWNGLSDQLLIGIAEKTSSGKRLCIWNIHQGKSFLEIELSDSPQILERRFSVDPYVFLPIISIN